MNGEGAPQAGGFLAELQRAQARGAGALDAFQGPVCDEIVLSRAAAEADDPRRIIDAVSQFAEAMRREGYYLPGEFAPEALYSYYARDYLSHVSQGGHRQYHVNRAGDALALKCAEAGLAAMGADAHLAQLRLLIGLADAEPRAVRKVLKALGWRSVGDALSDLDRRLAAAEAQEPLAPRHKAWLMGLSKLRPVAEEEVEAAWIRLGRANPLRERRRAEAAALHAARAQSDPAWQAVQALCAMAGLKFVSLDAAALAPMRTVWPEGPRRRGYIWRVSTDQGPRIAIFYGDGLLVWRWLAVLLKEGEPLPQGSLSLSRRQFEAIVPRRRR